MFGFVKVSTCMNCPESAEVTMDGLQLKKTGKLLITDFVTPILSKIFTFILGKESENVGKGKTRVSSYYTFPLLVVHIICKPFTKVKRAR